MEPEEEYEPLTAEDMAWEEGDRLFREWRDDNDRKA